MMKPLLNGGGFLFSFTSRVTHCEPFGVSGTRHV